MSGQKKIAALERALNAMKACMATAYAKRMYKLANCMADAIAVIDSCGKIIFWNKKAEKMFGYKNREITGHDIHKEILSSMRHNFHRDVLRKVRVSQRSNFRGGAFETDVRRRNGEVFRVEITTSGTKIDASWYLIVIFRDITRRRTVEKELIESEEKFRNLAEKSPNMIFINKSGRIVYANSRCREIMGYSRKEFYSPAFNFFKLIAPEYRTIIAKNYRKHRAEREVPSYEYELITKDGRRVNCIIATRLINFEGTKAILGIVTDITNRKQAEAETQRAKAHLERIIASLNEALFIIDARTRVISMCNPAVKKIFGYKPWELIGRTTRLLHIDSSHYKKFHSMVIPVLKKQGYSKVEFEMKHKNGTIIPTEHTVTVITDERGRWIGSVSVVEDISLRKKTQEWVAQYQKRLRVLASQLSNTEERERRHLAKKLHDHIGHLLAIAKIKLGFLKENVDTEKQLIVNDIRRMIEQSIRHIRTFTFELSPPILYELGLEAAIEYLADETETQSGIKVKLVSDGRQKPLNDEMRVFLFNAVQELLMNVLKHAQARNALISIRRHAGNIIINVADDGCGIRSIPVKPSKTSGYGLFSIRERLNLYGGDLKIESLPKRGTSVTVSCPTNPQ